MSKVRLTGSNSGYVEISAVADAGNLSFTMPTHGTALLGNGNNVFTGITTYNAALDINSSIDVSGTSVFNNDVTFDGATAGYDVVWDRSDNALEFADNAKISLGSGGDMQLYHDGNHTHLHDSGQGVVYLRTNMLQVNNADNNQAMAEFDTTSVDLYSGNSRKFQTTNTGVVVTGICTATSFSGSGEGLTRTSQYAHRNRFHNGGMTISQRFGDTETTLTHNNWTKILDRWKCYENTEGAITATRVHGSYPTAGTNPSSYSATRLKVTTADTSLSSSQQFMFAQIIEGFNWQDLRWGTSAAKSVTLSFNILATGASASNVTGTYCVQCSNPNNYNRAYIKEYTIDAINVWKKVTLTFPGDTSGTWGTGTDPACRFAWFLAAGTNHHGSANSWGAFKATTSNQKNFLSHVNNFIFITDVQVEEGTVATPFETKPFTTELQLCQRYYQVGSSIGAGYGSANGYARAGSTFATAMRVSPTFTATNTGSGSIIATGRSNTGFYVTYGSLGGTSAGIFNFTADAEY